MRRSRSANSSTASPSIAFLPVSPRTATTGRSATPIVFPNILSVGAGDERVDSRYYAFQIRVPADDTHTMHLSGTTAYMPPKGKTVPQDLLDKVHVYDVPLKDKDGDIHPRQRRLPEDIMACGARKARSPTAPSRTSARRTTASRCTAAFSAARSRRSKKASIRDVHCSAMPTKNSCIDLPNEGDKHHNAEGMRSWMVRAHPRGAFADYRRGVPPLRGASAGA